MPLDAAGIAHRLNLRRRGRLYLGACPSCGYDGAFTVQDRDGATLWRCHAGCDQSVVTAAICDLDGGWTPPPPAPPRLERDQSAGDAALTIWRRTVPAAGTVTETYLRHRIPGLPVIPPTIRHHPHLRHGPGGTMHPCMVAAITVWPDRQPRAIHRTYLRPDGLGKADVAPAKMSLGPLAGGAVRLAPHGPKLLVAEGIETTASAMVASGLPGWAALSTGGLRSLHLPDDVQEIVIAADNDVPGIAAAEDAARRWAAEGRRVRIAIPDRPGADWNDIVRSAA